MRALATTQQLMTWLSMYPVDESTTRRQKRIYIGYTWTISIVNVSAFCASFGYGLKKITIDFDGAVFGFMTAIAGFGIIYFMIAAMLMRERIGEIFTSLSDIYKRSKLNSISLESCNFPSNQRNSMSINFQMKMKLYFGA